MAKEFCITLEDAIGQELIDACGGDVESRLKLLVSDIITGQRVQRAVDEAKSGVTALDQRDVSVEVENV